VRVAVLGGTGSFGKVLAGRLVAAGEDDVVIGSREAARAQATAAELGGRATGAANADAVGGVDLAVLAVKAEVALETALAVADALGETPLLSVATVLSFAKDGVRPDPDARSLAERVQDVVRGPVVAGMHSIAAAHLPGGAPDQDILLSGDDAAAKALSLELMARLVDGRALDAGPLANARTLEGITAMIVNLNRRYKAHTGIRVTGLRV
jgi:8-hydroxy-5-deazaflavin:NADPH oxidoreductase